MAMLQLIMPQEFVSFLPKITLLYWNNHPTLQILAPCDFSKLKEVIKGTRFDYSETIKTAVTRDSEAIKKAVTIPVESFQECVEAWQRRLEKCI